MQTISGKDVSRFSFGTLQFGKKASEADSAEMYADCRAEGINFFDTAHAYTGGESEKILGRLASGERDDVFIATKCAESTDASPAKIREEFDTSRERLGMETVDVLYMHRWDTKTPLEETYDLLAEWMQAGAVRHILSQFDRSRRQLGEDFVDLLYMHRFDDATPLEETFEALAALQADGAIRHIGVSNYAAWQIMKAKRVAEERGFTVTFIQPMYNLLKRQVEVEILPMAQSEGFVVCPYSPLGGGLLTGKYARGGEGRIKDDPMYASRYAPDWMHAAAKGLLEIAEDVGVSPATLAVAWTARHPGVWGPIISARNAEQLEPSLAAIGFEMDDGLYARLSALTPTPPPATDRLEEAG